MPPDGGPGLDGARRRAAAQRRPGLRESRGDALAAARHEVRRLAELLLVPGAAGYGQAHDRRPGFDVVNLANNHADDFGPAGQRSTERALEGRGRALDRPPRADHDHAPRRPAHRPARLRALPLGAAARADPRRPGARAQGGRPGRPRGRRDARGRRGLGRDARAARHRDVPGREPRQLAPLLARRDRRRRRPRRRFGPARDPRHGALPRPPDRLLARQFRRLQELRHRRDALAERDPAGGVARRRRVRRRRLDLAAGSTATRCRTPIPPTPARASSRSSRARTSAAPRRRSRPDGALQP